MTAATKPRLIISRELCADLIAQAESEAPNECCGLLAGPWISGGPYRIAAQFPLVNALASPTEFESAPRELLVAHRTMREKNWEILAVYHSHPETAAIPSRKDRELHLAESVAMVIVGLKPTPAIRAWWLVAGEPREALIETG